MLKVVTADICFQTITSSAAHSAIPASHDAQGECLPLG
uniref:Uncharacterized protein n=1 Tax=Anguilla anguilla TaxID=7936 RepID=A0A0E9TZZ2_ANGAN